MEIVFVKENSYDFFELDNLNGFKFKPRNKDIVNLEIIDRKLIKKILSKKISRDIDKSTKAIKLMLESNITEINDCDIMINELKRMYGEDNVAVRY